MSLESGDEKTQSTVPLQTKANHNPTKLWKHFWVLGGVAVALSFAEPLNNKRQRKFTYFLVANLFPCFTFQDA